MPSATKKIFLGAAALGAVAVGVVPGTAQAATTQSVPFKICNHGSDYTVQSTFPDRGGFSSFVLSYGQCWEGQVDPGETFYLEVQRTDNPAFFATTLDHANNGPTSVTTKYTFTSFNYTKI
ncbi:hypothetical protein [Amycolatopsis sp. CA-230715]|uniref:hypothetical protein n=1 Tax=Amycolatopsis sp. CA-230715 TaxID=2745196 RepID=UPI001C0376C8|nr:hypothetical protein [Amycolatopsis sp. CA-230715]QWF82746.1 hypothetical protein HUW46_06185 [Amycolatopsis sp. CA-230715]